MVIFKDDNILITGGHGFLGSHVVDIFHNDGFNNIFTFTRSEYNLINENDVQKLFKSLPKIDIVIHIAADVGGIGYSSKHPAQQFYNNILINSYILHYSYINDVKKFVGIGSVCEYPAETPIPFKEEDLWDGYPVVTNDAYGLTKRMLLAQSVAYNREYGFNAIHLLPINLYGPRDDFSLENSHVIPALINKFYKAKVKNTNYVEVWGSGDVSREFVYVEDTARAILLATKNYNKIDPVNIGTGEEIKIRNLANLIADLVEYTGKIKFNKKKPEGQVRRKLDVSKAKKLFNFKAEIDLKEGLKRTIYWYRKNRKDLK